VQLNWGLMEMMEWDERPSDFNLRSSPVLNKILFDK
jgi:hypothetical protein